MNTEPKQALLQAEEAHRAAEQEADDTRGRVAVLAAEHEDRARAYDRDPSEENGRAVLAAREALSLAQLRADRAAGRTSVAAAALADARRDVEKGEAYEALRAAEEAATEAERARVRVLKRAAEHGIGTEVRNAIRLAVSWSDEIRTAIEEADRNVEAARAAVFAVREKLAALDPMCAASFPGERADFEEAAASLRRERSSVERFRMIARPFVDLYGLGFRMIVESSRALTSMIEAHPPTAEGAPLGWQHKIAHAMVGAVEHAPKDDREKLSRMVGGVVRRIFGVGSYTEGGAPADAFNAASMMLGTLDPRAETPAGPALDADLEQLAAVLSSRTDADARRAVEQLQAERVERLRAERARAEEEAAAKPPPKGLRGRIISALGAS